MVRPKKHLGQHFLMDENIARKITGLLQAESCDAVIEVGPGKGVLSKILFQREGLPVKLVEIDSESVDYLIQEFGDHKDSVVENDFLKVQLNEFGENIAVIGNFPYNISSQIFFHILEFRDNVSEVVCMLQKEVAHRLASSPGNKQYGILSVFLQTWYDISVEFNVGPGAFFPRPAVESTVIRLKRNSRKSIECNQLLYRRVIKTAFNQRRKILSNSLKSILLNLDAEIPYLKKRPEELSVDQFIELCRRIEENL